MHTKDAISFIITKELASLKEHLFIPHYFVSEGQKVRPELSGGTSTQNIQWHVPHLDVGGPGNHTLSPFIQYLA